MNFRRHSVAILCGVLLLAAGCGEPEDAPSLPGPVQVDGSQFVSAQEYLFTPGSVLESTDMRLDFINPRFDQGIPVRTTTSQGSGEARLLNAEADLKPVGETFLTNNQEIDDTANQDTLSIELASTLPPIELTAFAPNDSKLTTQIFIGGLVASSNNTNDQRIRVNHTFSGSLVDRDPTTGEVINTIATLTLKITRILVSNNGNQVVLEGDASLIALTTGVYVEEGGFQFDGETIAAGSFINPDDEGVTAILTEGSFSSSFIVRQRGVAGGGDGEDPLSTLARLNFIPNQAEIVYTPNQAGTQSVLYAPDPTRDNALRNQLVNIRRLLDGRIQAEFDPANTSTVLNFVQTNPPPEPFPTPVPQLTPDPLLIPPSVFDYFFAMRTEREDNISPVDPDRPVILQGIAPITGDFTFRSLAGAQLAGPFNRADIGGGTLRGNVVLTFDQAFDEDGIPGTDDDCTGQFIIEQEFPSGNTEDSSGDEPGTPADSDGRILIIRGFFNGPQVSL
jgi:hypothetical protein